MGIVPTCTLVASESQDRSDCPWRLAYGDLRDLDNTLAMVASYAMLVLADDSAPAHVRAEAAELYASARSSRDAARHFAQLLELCPELKAEDSALDR